MKTHGIMKSILIVTGIAALFFQALAGQFTLIALPDTQKYNMKPNPNHMNAETDWILANKETLNIVFVTQLGDFTQEGSSTEYWKYASSAIETLDGKIPYSVTFGNHDLRGENAVPACRAFGASKTHQGAETYGGASPDGLSFYQIFSGGGFKILHLNIKDLKTNSDDTTFAWANDVIKVNPDLPVIVSTHNYLNPAGGRSKLIWDKLVSKNSRIFMVLCGHYGGTAQKLEKGESGVKVIQMLADWDYCDNDPKYVFLRQIIFKPEDGKIEFKTYSPTMKSFNSDLDHEYSFDASFDPAKNTISILGQTGLPRDTVTPCILSNLTSQVKVVEGQPASFSVTPEGTPPLSYQWSKKEGRKVLDIPGATAATYTSPPVTAKDNGTTFTVRVSNAAGSVSNPYGWKLSVTTSANGEKGKQNDSN